MLTVLDYAAIRQAHRDGLTIRQIAQRFGHSSKTVIKALNSPEPAPYSTSKPRASPTFGPYRDLVDRILDEDRHAPKKQRHTARQIFRRLQQEHDYRGGYDQVRRHVKASRQRSRETFIPLDHPPGRRAEADFGLIHVDFPEGRRQVSVLVVTWSHSNCPFAIALPSQKTEAILHGLCEAFEFFGGVPAELWWDNPKTLAARIGPGRQRELHPRYAALGSHYQFTPMFCLPRKANGKPAVEHRVYDLQRRWATPVPAVADLAELDARLRHCCLRERDRRSGDDPRPVGERFAADLTAASPLPGWRFDACVPRPVKADKYQQVRFETNRYSVPARFAFRDLTLKAYVWEVALVADGREVARHRRCYGRGESILEPTHHLKALSRRPAALDHSAVFRDWQLPEVFGRLRRRLEGKHGPAGGRKQYAAVLALLAEHPADRLVEAIGRCLELGTPEAVSVRSRAEILARCRSEARPPEGERSPAVEVPRPDLRRFDQLLSRGGDGDG